MYDLKHYVEFFYPYNPDVASSMCNTEIHLIEDRNPILFTLEDHSKIGYRFFDVEGNKNPLLKINRINISSMYYYGEYLTKEEIDYIHSIMPYTLKNNLMIRCYCGYLVTDVLEDLKIATDESIRSLILNNRC